MTYPGGWQFLLLALAAFRVTRLIGWDSITEKIRQRILVKATGAMHGSRRVVTARKTMLAKLISCPWCLGWWVCLAWWAAWEIWPAGTVVAATPWALSALVGLIAKNADP